ncbi:MAG TPA: MFS transporter [Caulobacteraceae bacterium]|nr:MFS transporter [Caulobacteraceae bacterium]
MWDVLAALGRPRVSLMLLMGISSGLPFMLIGNTLGGWLKAAGVGNAAIGFATWVGMTYTIKFLWGAMVDRIPLPLIGRLGRRRSWMLIAQVVAGAGLIGMGLVSPKTQFSALVLFAGVAALGAAVQDTAMDAWRIEIAADPDELGLLTASYSVGYRVALIFTEAVILVLADRVGWPASYVIYGAAMTIGVVAVLLAREPVAADAVMESKSEIGARSPAWAIYDAVLGPLIAFFRTHGLLMSTLMLLTITFYHLSDYMRGPMSLPYYISLKIPYPVIALTRIIFGTPCTFLGIALGGLSSLRLGNRPTLLLGAFAQPVIIGSFAILGFHGGDFPLIGAGPMGLTSFQAIMGLDSIAIGFSGVALVAYMSTLTSLGYTATQYALLTSAVAILGKFLKGFSGAIVDALQPGHTPDQAFALFYLCAAALGLPAILLCLLLPRPTPKAAAG